MTETEKPPYTSGADVDALFAKIAGLKAPKKIDAEWATTFLGSKQGSAIPTLLDWLGITADGVPNEDTWQKLRFPESRAETLPTLIRTAYGSVFDILEVESADRSDLDRAFASAYKLGDVGRYVKCFLALASHAGLDIAAAHRQATPTQGPKGARAASPQRTAGLAAARPRRPGGAGGKATEVMISLVIPAEWGPDEIRKRIELVREIARGDASR